MHDRCILGFWDENATLIARCILMCVCESRMTILNVPHKTQWMEANPQVEWGQVSKTFPVAESEIFSKGAKVNITKFLCIKKMTKKILMYIIII